MLKKVYFGKNGKEATLNFKSDLTLESDGEGGMYIGVRSNTSPEWFWPWQNPGQSVMVRVPRESAIPVLKALMEEMEAEVRGEVK